MMTVGIPQVEKLQNTNSQVFYKVGQKFFVADSVGNLHKCVLVQISCKVLILIDIKSSNRMFDAPVECFNAWTITASDLNQMTKNHDWALIKD